MGFDDILKAANEDRVRASDDLRQLQMRMGSECDEFAKRATATITSALQALPDMGHVAPLGSLPPPSTNDSATRHFTVVARTKNGNLEFLVSGSVRCFIAHGVLRYEPSELTIAATRHDTMTPRTQEGRFRIACDDASDPAYEIDAAAFEVAMKAVVRALV